MEETLADTAPGTFLVRKSSRPDHYALSVQLGGKIANMLITPRLTEVSRVEGMVTREWKWLAWDENVVSFLPVPFQTGQVLYRLGTNEREFSSLKALVEHYMNTGEHGLTPFSVSLWQEKIRDEVLSPQISGLDCIFISLLF